MYEMDFPRFRDVNIDRSFQKLKDHIFINYRGALIMRDKHPDTQKEGFYWKDRWFENIGDASRCVDEVIEVLRQSISVSMTITRDNEEVSVLSEYTNQYFVGGSPYESFKRSQQ